MRLYCGNRNQAFCLALYLTGVHIRGELQHVGHTGGQKIKCRPIRTREIGGVRLQVELCVTITRLLLRNVHQRLNRVLLLNLIHGVIIALLFFIII